MSREALVVGDEAEAESTGAGGVEDHITCRSPSEYGSPEASP